MNKAKITSVVFYSPDTFYAVINILHHQKIEKLSGIIYSPFPGQEISFTGNKIHTAYGEQYKAEQIIPHLAQKEEDLIGCLSGDAFPRIGPSTAAKIIKTIGADNFWEKITPDIQHQLRVNKITPHLCDIFYDLVQNYKNHIKLIPVLVDAKIPAYKINEIISAFGSKTEEILKTNPYLLLQKIDGLSFALVDAIAQKYELSMISSSRVNAGIIETLKEYNKTSGDSGIEFNALFSLATKFLAIDEGIVYAQLNGLIDNKELLEEKIADYTFVFLPSVYYTELGIKSNLDRLASSHKTTHQANLNNLNIQLSDQQVLAINNLINQKITLLTGMPGSGKTTIVKYAIDQYKKIHPKAKIVLSAPTGKAAARLSEATFLPASTNHRLLGCDKSGKFTHNEFNQLKIDLLILDECSMIDIYLLHAILKALPNNCHLWLIGDPNQLPPVNCGAPFRDIINSKKFPHISLSTVFRQGPGSFILKAASSLLAKEGIPNHKTNDFHFLNKENEEENLDRLINLYLNDITVTRQIARENIQILVPQRTGPLGTQNLNYLIQKKLNENNSKKLKWLDNYFYLSDKVIQIKNNYDKDVYNGEIGIITKISNQNFSLTVKFDNRQIEYTKQEIEELQLAYALTIHKFQGSEAECILFPVAKSHFKMLTPRLLYTGLTRAKKLLVLTGSRNFLNFANQKNNDVDRFSMLPFFFDKNYQLF